MPRHHYKSKINNSHDNMSPPEPSIAGPEYSNIPEAQDKDFKIGTMNMFKDLKEDMDKSPQEGCENTQWNA